MAKIIFTCGALISAFLNFTLSVRYINHATMLMIIPNSDRELESKKKLKFPVNEKVAAQTLNKGFLHYTLGMRSYYFMFPIASWMFGPLFMLVVTFFLLVFLFYLDHAAIKSPFNLLYNKLLTKHDREQQKDGKDGSAVEATLQTPVSVTPSSAVTPAHHTV